MAAVRLSDVAREAGVSPATASRVLNGSARTPAREIAERVRAAAAALGYIPNAQAQALARSSTGLLGLVVHDIADPYFSSIARGFQQAARRDGRTVLLATTDGTPQDERRALEALASHRTEAVALAGSRSVAPHDEAANAALSLAADRFIASGGRLIVIGHPLVGRHRGDGEELLRIPNEELSAEMARALAGIGHRQFTVIAGPEHLVTSDRRVAGFQRGLKEAGLPEADVLRLGFDRDGGYEAGQRLAPQIAADRAGGRRRCLFSVNDRMAIGALAGLRDAGFAAPRDYAIAGFDDIQSLQDFRPSLTTVRLPLEEIGQQAAHLVLSDRGQQYEVTGEVVLRRSSELADWLPAPSGIVEDATA